jgi:type II secretory pathway pseudopilin PulG
MSSLSTAEAALIVFAVVTSSLAATYFQVKRARREESTRDRIIRAAHERAEEAARLDGHTLADAARGQRLPADVEDHLVRFLVDNPDVADGFARLRQAVRDEQQKGEQA